MNKNTPSEEDKEIFNQIMNQIEIMKNNQITFITTVGEFIETINTNITQPNTFTDENTNNTPNS